MFRRLFTLLPDLIATPRRSAVHGDIVFNDSDRDAVDVAVLVHEPGRAFNVVLGSGQGSQPWLVVHEPQPRRTEVGADIGGQAVDES